MNISQTTDSLNKNSEKLPLDDDSYVLIPNWLKCNWDKIFTVIVSLLSMIIAGVIGFYSSKHDFSEKISLLEGKLKDTKHELELKIVDLDRKYEKKFITVNGEIKMADKISKFNKELIDLKYRTDNNYQILKNKKTGNRVQK